MCILKGRQFGFFSEATKPLERTLLVDKECDNVVREVVITLEMVYKIVSDTINKFFGYCLLYYWSKYVIKYVNLLLGFYLNSAWSLNCRQLPFPIKRFCIVSIKIVPAIVTWGRRTSYLRTQRIIMYCQKSVNDKKLSITLKQLLP